MAGARPTFGKVAVCAAAGMRFGALNESIEFIARLILPEHNIGGYRNSGWDLVSSFVGAAMAATIIYPIANRRLVGSRSRA